MPTLTKESLDRLIANNKFVFLVLFLVPFLVYLDVYTFQYAKDDYFSVLPLPGLDQLSSIPKYFVSPVQFLNPATKTLEDLHYYRPIATSTLTIDFFLYGKEHPGILHIENLLLHILNGVLLFLLFTRLTSRAPAFIAALLYSVFPMSTEMVSIYHYRVDLLCSFFIFLTLYLTVSLENNRWHYAVSVSFLAAMLSKEIAITLLVLVPFLRYHRFSTFSIQNGIVVLLLPMLFYWSMRYNALGDFIAPPNEFNLDIFKEMNVGFITRMELVFEAFAQRSYWMFSPFEIQPKVKTDLLPSLYWALTGLLLLVSLTASALYYFKSRTTLHLAPIGLLTTWFPLSSILVAVPAFGSARHFYYPAPWIILLIVLIISSLSSRSLRILLFIWFFAIWSTSSYIQKYWYKNNVAVRMGMVTYYPNSPLDNYHAGRVLIEVGDYEDAHRYTSIAFTILIAAHGDIETAAQKEPHLTLDVMKQLVKYFTWKENYHEADKLLKQIERLFPEKDLSKEKNLIGEKKK